ncbi:FliA/WhiG family RNA polymerase sigma factor [Jeotgalibacillus sp. S-D1]|uniref:FliA/WhiG family RNA polymerase sigma factor n=1 Tax=Jeotgalibacillus sp. S-D1 TaxID=2552189 RepID=UPI00105A7D92|nr:FliA/WhiG family RNA polymerase sigma factor [Jeotgalibacillus sp. S-D1]TDL35027.1 FliA/WhiG family RNA polymerase sigma factor [Jeotgalibacillus sp. S-D1]
MNNSTVNQEKYYWKLWHASRDSFAGDMLIQQYIPLVQYHVHRIGAGLPANVSREELKSLGLMGLLDALLKFDLSRDLKFDTYASFRIRGAIIDGLRKEDWLPRSTRDRAKKIDAKIEELEQEKLRHVNADEVAAALDINVEEIYRFSKENLFGNVISIDDQSLDSAGNDLIDYTLKDNQTVLPEESVIKNELIDDLSEVISGLNEKEQLVLSLFYSEELTLTEIGEVMSLSTSRISQIHSKSLFKLKKLLSSEFNLA